MKPSKSKIVSKILMILFFIVYYAPIVSMVVFSFNSERSLTTWYGFSFEWYTELFTNEAIIKVVVWTIVIAICSTAISVIIATLASIALCKTKRSWRKAILQINNFPITNPDIVTALGLLLLFVSLGVTRGYGTMLLAHISFCTPYAIINIYPKIKALDENLVEAAMDLGAKPMQAIKKAILPQIKGAILAAAAISFTMSFDDFVISYFTGGTDQNISTLIYSQLKKTNPTFNALSTIIIMIIVLKIVIDKLRENRKKEEE